MRETRASSISRQPTWQLSFSIPGCWTRSLPLTLGLTTRPRPLRAPLYTVSTMSMSSCLLFMAQLILLLLPVPKSIMMCLLRKKNMVVQGSYSSYMVLKSGTSEMSTR